MSTKAKGFSLKEKMFELLEAQKKSGLSQVQFCKREKMSIATFSYWRKKYLVEKQKTSSNLFVPIQIKAPRKKNHLIEILLPNKMILRSDAWQSDQLCSLIKELQKM